MKLTYTLSPNKAPKNVWVVSLEWMSGDADHSEYLEYEFETEEKCIAFVTEVNRILDFTNDYWNLVCWLESNGHLEESEFIERELRYINVGDRDKKRNELRELWKIVKTLIGDKPTWRDYLESVVGEVPYDVTTDGDSHAKLRSINSIVKYDENGTKFDAKVS